MTISDQQFKALHVYCEHLAIALNDAGYEMKAFMGRRQNQFILTIIQSIRELLDKAEGYITNCPEADIPWDKESVKKYIIKPIIKAKFDKDSTTKLTVSEAMGTYEIANRFTSDKFGVHVPFPSEDER